MNFQATTKNKEPYERAWKNLSIGNLIRKVNGNYYYQKLKKPWNTV